MTRLVYRKGIDLLVSAAPKICALYPRVRFIVGQSSCLNEVFEKCADEAKHRPTTNVYRSSLALAGLGGDGPKMVELEQMREQHLLQDRIVLLGAVSPNDVHSVSRLRYYRPQAAGRTRSGMSCSIIIANSSTLAGPEPRPDLPLYFPHGSFRDQHYRGRLGRSVYCQHQSRRGT
jgi:hypothetical protein